nr:splicing factor 1-like [Salvelinus alpinus]
MQHRMMKDAQRAMGPWMGGQPIYSPMSHGSSQMNPLLYAGSQSGKSIAMAPMPLPPPPSGYSMPPSVHAASIYGNQHPGNKQMLDYLESQVRGMDGTSPMMQPQPYHQQVQMMPPPPQHMMPQHIPFSAGPPSMLSGLDDGAVEYRGVIQMPPIIEQPGRGGRRGGQPPLAPKTRPPSSRESSRSESRFTNHRDDRSEASGRRYPSPSRSRATERLSWMGDRRPSRKWVHVTTSATGSLDPLQRRPVRGAASPRLPATTPAPQGVVQFR